MDALHLYPSVLARDAALDALPDAAWTGGHLTFPEFMAQLDRVLPATGADLAALAASSAARQALLKLAARGSEAAELERVAGSERALRAAETLIGAWKELSLRPEDLRAAAAELEARPETAGAARTVMRLARLYELYEQRLGRNATDREGFERDLLRRLNACGRIPPRLLRAGARVELHDFHRLAYVQFRIVESLIRFGHDVRVDSPLFGDEARRAKFEGLAKTFGAVKFSAADRSAGAASRANITRRMESAGPYAEVYEIGRRVARWISEEKIAPHEIGVSFRDLGLYSQALHDVFRRLGIPFYERRGEPAQFQPMVRAALSAVDACVNGLDRRSVFRFLCAGPLDVAALAGSMDRAGGTPAPRGCDAAALHDLALEAGIDRAHGATANADVAHYWNKRLERFLAPNTKHARAADARNLLSIIERLNAMRVERTAYAHAQAWRAFFEACGLSSARVAAEFTDERRDASETTALLKQRLAMSALEAALNDVAAIPGAAAETMPLETFAEFLALAIQERSVRAEGAERAGVRVLNYYDLRGLSFKRLAIGGLAEGWCPARPGPDALLGKGAEGALRQALGKRLADRDARLFLAPRLADEHDLEERALFEGALAAAGDMLLLSRPRCDFDGKALGPSEYWEEFDAEVEVAMPIHPAPKLGECFTAEEAELRAAWILGGATPATETAAANASAVESAAALAAYHSSPRLQAIARRAAVERSRYQYFLDQALAAAKGENAPARESVSASVFDGVVASVEQLAGETPAVQATPPQMVFAEIHAAVAKKLAPGGIGDPMLSPSDIEKLAQCPFRFFAERVCRLDSSEEPGEEISPLDLGELTHRVLNRFYREELARAEKDGHLTARLDCSKRSAYLNRLLFFAGEEMARTSLEKFTGHPGFWKFQEQRLRALLGKWLDCELLEPADGFFPARVEFPFGPYNDNGTREIVVPLSAEARGQKSEFRHQDEGERLPLTPRAGTPVGPLPEGEGKTALRIKGRIDRIDFKIEERGGVATVVGLRVIDYKSGRGTSYREKTKEEQIEQLLSAQLPIYAAAAVSLLMDLKEEKKIDVDMDSVWTNSAAGFYALRDTPFRSRDGKAKVIAVQSWPLGDLRTFLDVSAPAGGLFDVARGRVSEILSGNFAVRPLDCGGARCPARYVCRFQAIPAMGDEE